MAGRVDRTVKGVFSLSGRGYGFVTPDDPKDGEDVFIPAARVNGAWNRDRVEVELINSGRREGIHRRGKIVRVLERKSTLVTADYKRGGKFGFALPDDPKLNEVIYIPDKSAKHAEEGDKVLVEIEQYGDRKHTDTIGSVRRIIGRSDDPGIDLYAIMLGLSIPTEFPPDVQREVKRFASVNVSSEKAEEEERILSGREDLRTLLTVTIDGPDAKDLDDAVSLVKKNNGYTLGVHIADVSFYVKEGSALDREALNRGTSVYPPGCVIPMLPEELSAGSCSLKSGEDRRTLSVLMEIDAGGRVCSHRIVRSLIRVDECMTYPDVLAILEGSDQYLTERYAAVIPMLKEMQALSSLIRQQRERRGAIDFDFPEARIELDDAGRALGIYPENHNAATRLIEDFMLTANETVAEAYAVRGLPFMYRIHEEPDPDKIEELILFMRSQGVRIEKKRQKISPMELRCALEEIKGHRNEALFARTILRSMQQARYSPFCSGHFGLAAKYYCHFTSPIRRYPDLLIHRIINEDLAGSLDSERISRYKCMMEDAAARCSFTERRADEAEHEAEKLKKAEYMSRHIGEEFFARVSSVCSRGLYAELENTVEGLVEAGGMCDDYYSYDEDERVLRGRLKGKVYAVGDEIRVRVTAADIRTRTVAFELA